MAIAVSCQCGKSFKVKDEMAGKAVRCPACRGPLRIPGTQGAAVAAVKSSSAPGERAPNPEAALLKFEEAKKKKQLTAEEEAAYKVEQKKLIESYDQLAGKGGKGSKDRPTVVFTKKASIFRKLADVFHAMFGTLAVKYLIIAALVAVGAVVSVAIVKYVTGYMSEETTSQLPKEDRIRLFLKQAEEAAVKKNWAEVARNLDEIDKLDPKKKELHRDYRRLRQQSDEALKKNNAQTTSKPGPKATPANPGRSFNQSPNPRGGTRGSPQNNPRGSPRGGR